MRAWLLLGVLLLAGCSGKDGSSDGEGGDAADTGMDDGMGMDGNATVDAPVLHEVPVEFEGNLGTSAVFCESTSGQCQGASPMAGQTDYLYEHPGATLVAVNLTLTWEATSAATETLGLGAMRMGANSTLIENVEGMSPLAIQAEGLDLLLDADNQFHAYVYNAQGLVHQDPVFGYVSADDDFRVEGTLTFEVPQ